VIDEKRQRDAAVLGALHGIVFDDEVEATGGPQFDGGVRGETFASRRDPTLRPALERQHSYREPGGWVTTEIEDGASLLFPRRGR
jgi:hypothetical protein